METPPVERKLVAILAADIAGYSRLMHEDEEATLATLSSHRAIVDSLVQALQRVPVIVVHSQHVGNSPYIQRDRAPEYTRPDTSL